MSIAPKLQLILDTKAGLKSYLGIPNGVPFSQYKNWINWKDATPPADLLFADYTKDRYSVSGAAASFSDVNEFTRLTAATNFVDGSLVEYAANKPRIETGKGLLVEPQATNRIIAVNPAFLFDPFEMGVSPSFYVKTTVPVNVAVTFISAGDWAHTGRSSIQVISDANINWYPSIPRNLYMLIGAARTESMIKTKVSDDLYRNAMTVTDYASDRVAIGQGASYAAMTKLTKIIAYQFEAGDPTSIIINQSSPATRSPDLNRITVPLGKTLTLDADAGVTYIMENATTALITATEPGYIRSARVN